MGRRPGHLLADAHAPQGRAGEPDAGAQATRSAAGRRTSSAAGPGRHEKAALVPRRRALLSALVREPASFQHPPPLPPVRKGLCRPHEGHSRTSPAVPPPSEAGCVTLQNATANISKHRPSFAHLVTSSERASVGNYRPEDVTTKAPDRLLREALAPPALSSRRAAWGADTGDRPQLPGVRCRARQSEGPPACPSTPSRARPSTCSTRHRHDPAQVSNAALTVFLATVQSTRLLFSPL